MIDTDLESCLPILVYDLTCVLLNMSEKLCLQWIDFKENVIFAFGSLREDNNFADVTLACEDGQQVEAHKVILAASSPFFKTLFERNKHPHPLIYMRGVKYANLLSILEFLYRGEANFFQDDLDSFLAIAEELQLKGLKGTFGPKTKLFQTSSTRVGQDFEVEVQARF